MTDAHEPGPGPAPRGTGPAGVEAGPPEATGHVVEWRNSLGAKHAPTRGRRQSAFFRLRGEIPLWQRAVLSVLGLLTVLVVWAVVAANTSSFIVPSPAETWTGFQDLRGRGVLWPDFKASVTRILIGYSISVAIGVVLGILIGSFRSAEAYFEGQIGFIRYIPATALLPVFLFWLGIDEAPKIALIVVGTVFFNILMTADVARAVPRQLINASYTFGAGRLTILRRVILPHSFPGIIDVARINLAAAWLMLVVAELLAAEDGLAVRIIRAQRFRDVDEMFALLIILGLIGVATDLSLRWLRDRLSPWARP